MRMAFVLQGIGFLILFIAVYILFQKTAHAPEKQQTFHETKEKQTKIINNNKTIMNDSNIIVRSPAFNNEELIPSKYTCDEENISPPLAIDNIPENTVSLVLMMDDPDATNGETWDHWIAFNIPKDNTRIGEGDEPKGVSGNNSWNKTDYGGPCPPVGSGAHRYFFKVYALDSSLRLQKGATKHEIEEAMKGHIISTGELMGKYKRVEK